jgi:probable HAF family extracellular repeat protein
MYRRRRIVKSRELARIAATAVAGLSISLQVAAQQHPLAQHHHYKLIDIGTFGGPSGGIVNPSSLGLNNRGMMVGASDTAAADPYAPGMCFADCYVIRSFLWSNGKSTELLPLPDGKSLSGIASSINARGWIIGQAQNGKIDPGTGWPESRGVLWRGDSITDLGTLGGPQAIANAINDFGQIVGAALTKSPDPFANNPLTACSYLPTTGFACAFLTFAQNADFFPGTTESHAFLWHAGSMRDLGTLGGPDSAAWIINDRGQVAGFSFVSFVANPSTGVPTVDPFIWDPRDGAMKDIGGLGGTYGSPQWMNNRGQVVGSSNLAGDTGSHPFLWSEGVLTDLGVFYENPSAFGIAFSINDAGEVVGTAQTSTGIAAFFWKNGTMQNLGTVDNDPCSQAFSINSKSQVVGVSDSCATGADLHGFLWENGGPIVDLNQLVLSGDGLTVINALLINDHGEIGCLVQLPDGNTHPCVLIPCDDAHPGIDDCEYSWVDTRSVARPSITAQESRGTPSASRGRAAQSDRRGSSLWRRHVAPVH